ncbi:YbgA family protein [Lactiplantibacillus paraplantarum]|uniref:YbgA family protein n=1 Tax=Lactiplantibacillus paraplantarum TaxID=60520 RepID=UPI000512FA9B|nr:YbgA family protein [Lactiplantibacillus paraplantarum]OAX76592.1 hypothetical protein A0U96_02895 [Lactiplantibacillus plantarum]ALO04380.1 hypothetical protein ASU28_08465 [Lactiplantibacillus paraplantarum]KGE75258.1 hypothetical protein HR47_08260 [Lactiplantibacillus paraplantarum]MCT4455854.1 DUF1722 domain-containing protein [Lactiplantibacillus paraplantarum]MCW1910414.1 YbgA family protein [Lactiplantibacillus paraplantarum]
MTQWQREWAYQKYWVMAHSQQHYDAIRQLASNNQWSATKEARLKQLLAEAARQPPTKATLTTAYQHVWGYFKKRCTTAEKQRYLALLATLTPEHDLLGPFLRQLALKYQVPYLLSSRLLLENNVARET